VSRLDELLDAAQEPPPRPRTSGREWGGWLVKAVLLAAAGTVPIYVGFRLAGKAIPVLLPFGLLLAVGVLYRLGSLLRSVGTPPVLLRPSAELRLRTTGPTSGRDGLEAAIAVWRTRLLHVNPEQFGRVVQPPLIALVDERLRLRHGVTLAGDPARARALLGDPLWTFVTQPYPRSPTPRDLAALVRYMEEL
jgi:hypothetical protein